MTDVMRKVGADGRSAYQVAVDNGFTGTAEDWTALMYRAPMIIPVLGAITAGELVCRADLPVAVWVDTDLTEASCDTVSTGAAVFAITVDGVSVGTATFGAGQTDAVFAWSDTSFGPGLLKVTAPNPADATLRNLSLTLMLKLAA